VIYAIRLDHSAARPPERAPPARTKAADHPGRPSGLRITEREPRDPRTQPPDQVLLGDLGLVGHAQIDLFGTSSSISLLITTRGQLVLQP
jgi:hypothetical protein